MNGYYQAGYTRNTKAGNAPSDAPYLIDGSTSVAGLTSEVLIGALASSLTWALADAATNSASDLFTWRHTTSGLVAANFGLDIEIELEDAGGNTDAAGRLRWFWQGVTSNSEQSALSLYVTKSAALIEVARFTGSTVAGNEAFMIGNDGGTASIVNIDDTNTGITWAGADQLYIVSGGINSVIFNTSGAMIVNNGAGALIDFRVNGDTVLNLFFVDVSQDNIGIGGAPTAGYRLHVNQPASTTGAPFAFVVTGGAHTGLTSDATTTDVLFDLGRTVEFKTGDLTGLAAITIEGPTYAAVGSSTYTGVSTMSVQSVGTGANVICASALCFRIGSSVTYTNHSASFGYAAIFTDNHTITLSGSTNLTSAETIMALDLQQITVTSTNAINIPSPATLYIEGPPIAGGSITFTSGPFAIFVDAGNIRTDGVIYAELGTATAPAYSFHSGGTLDGNTGLFSPGGDIVGITCGGNEVVRWTLATVGGWQIMDEADSNPTTTQLDANDSLAFYNKADTLVFAYNNAGTITYVKLALDGSATTWVHNTTAP